MDLLIIEHKDGRTYAVPPAAFRKTYESEGFRAVRFESGKSYEPSPRKSEKPEKADEEK